MSTSFAEAAPVHSQDLQQLATDIVAKAMRAGATDAEVVIREGDEFSTLVRLGQRLCRSPEEWKVWSQNLGHESEATTFVGYGQVPAHRHAEIMRAFSETRPDPLPAGLDIAARSFRAF